MEIGYSNIHFPITNFLKTYFFSKSKFKIYIFLEIGYLNIQFTISNLLDWRGQSSLCSVRRDPYLWEPLCIVATVLPTYRLYWYRGCMSDCHAYSLRPPQLAVVPPPARRSLCLVRQDRREDLLTAIYQLCYVIKMRQYDTLHLDIKIAPKLVDKERLIQKNAAIIIL